MYKLFIVNIIFGLFLNACVQPESKNLNEETLHGQFIEKNNDGLIKTIGNFNQGERDGQFIYFDLIKQRVYYNKLLGDFQIPTTTNTLYKVLI